MHNYATDYCPQVWTLIFSAGYEFYTQFCFVFLFTSTCPVLRTDQLIVDQCLKNSRMNERKEERKRKEGSKGKLDKWMDKYMNKWYLKEKLLLELLEESNTFLIQYSLLGNQ